MVGLKLQTTVCGDPAVTVTTAANCCDWPWIRFTPLGLTTIEVSAARAAGTNVNASHAHRRNHPAGANRRGEDGRKHESERTGDLSILIPCKPRGAPPSCDVRPGRCPQSVENPGTGQETGI